MEETEEPRGYRINKAAYGITPTDLTDLCLGLPLRLLQHYTQRHFRA
jgi:hypothetical protein